MLSPRFPGFVGNKLYQQAQAQMCGAGLSALFPEWLPLQSYLLSQFVYIKRNLKKKKDTLWSLSWLHFCICIVVTGSLS